MNWITASEADSAKQDFDEFMYSAHEHRSNFPNFSMENDINQSNQIFKDKKEKKIQIV